MVREKVGGPYIVVCTMNRVPKLHVSSRKSIHMRPMNPNEITTWSCNWLMSQNVIPHPFCGPRSDFSNLCKLFVKERGDKMEGCYVAELGHTGPRWKGHAVVVRQGDCLNKAVGFPLSLTLSGAFHHPGKEKREGTAMCFTSNCLKHESYCLACPGLAMAWLVLFALEQPFKDGERGEAALAA